MPVSVTTIGKGVQLSLDALVPPLHNHHLTDSGTLEIYYH
jgi:hypothetical protein